MLREMLFLFSSERRVIRDYMILLFAIVGFAIIGAQATVKAMAWLVPAAQETLVAAPRPAQAAETRVYTVTRSVLDDRMTTGSIGPATGRDTGCNK
ncbi:MAG: hypothetical protein J0L51_11970 [Rhizobiales bacterium]|nr:hypothetical protein [Hyphomicrobiales bacterium]